MITIQIHHKSASLLRCYQIHEWIKNYYRHCMAQEKHLSFFRIILPIHVNEKDEEPKLFPQDKAVAPLNLPLIVGVVIPLQKQCQPRSASILVGNSAAIPEHPSSATSSMSYDDQSVKIRGSVGSTGGMHPSMKKEVKRFTQTCYQ